MDEVSIYDQMVEQITILLRNEICIDEESMTDFEMQHLVQEMLRDCLTNGYHQ